MIKALLFVAVFTGLLPIFLILLGGSRQILYRVFGLGMIESTAFDEIVEHHLRNSNQNAAILGKDDDHPEEDSNSIAFVTVSTDCPKRFNDPSANYIENKPNSMGDLFEASAILKHEGKLDLQIEKIANWENFSCQQQMSMVC